MLPHLVATLRTLIAFAIVLGVLVFVHELGHYLAARWRGVRVEAFSIGFGRAFASWTDRAGTVWKLAWLPLGGYVKMHGQERPEDVAPEVRARWIEGETFQGKPVGSRVLIVAAGPIANFVLAVVLFTLLFATVGRPVALPEVGGVVPASAAAAAGLREGDRVLAIDGQPVQRFLDIQRIVVARPGQHVTVRIARGNATETVPVTLGARMMDGQREGVLGISAGKTNYVRVGPLGAVAAGATQTWQITRDTVAGIGQMISGRRGTADLGGPLRIAELSGQVAELGFASLISFIAVLSVNLGLINLFPIPILDGGHLLFYLAEAIRGRPIPPRALEYGYRAGFALLAGLFLFATWNDLTQLGIFRWMAGL